jgi:hypothetical protein
MVSMLAVAQTDSPADSAGTLGGRQGLSQDSNNELPPSPSPAGWATLNPINWALGDVPVEFGYFQVFIVANGSSGNVTINSVVLSSSPSFFVASNSCQQGLMLQPGYSCITTVGFYATDLGSASATLRIHTSAGVLPANMTATAVMDNVTLTPLDCGGVPQAHFPCRVDMWGPPSIVTLTNDQGTSLTIDSITAEPSTLFSILPATTCPQSPSGGTVPPHGSCTIHVKYTGNSDDSVTGTLTVTDSAPDGTPYYINLCHKPYCE